ncbi:Aldo-ket-red domain-containing protein [Mycena indigotica]|uniref:Aldo-ket-red domain-containing protein n=1 Tax=Mycena indigotica TaxID=2126181 RepID=A0A8H6RXP1_9AGAR|nr:Aldo-ket-red domain-containing protein [Mycena indigotica]KAF7288793.1 Aldo-ket-red domain-containing protein [Mycena indigotica]
MDDPPFPREIELHIFRGGAAAAAGHPSVDARSVVAVAASVEPLLYNVLSLRDPEAGPTLNTPFPVLSPSAFRALIEDPPPAGIHRAVDRILNSCPHLQDVVILPRGLIFSTADVLGTLPNLRRLTTNLLSLYMMTASPDLSRSRASHTSTCRSTTAGRKSGRRFWRSGRPTARHVAGRAVGSTSAVECIRPVLPSVGKVPLDERLIEHPACLLVHQGIGWPEWQDEWTGGATSAGFWERVDKMLAERRSAGAPGKYDNDCAFNLLSSVKHTKSTVCGTPSTASPQDIIRLRNLVERRRRRTLYASATSWNVGVDWWPGTSGWCRLLSYTSADKSRARTADTAEGPTAKKAVCQRDPNPQREGLHRPDAPLDSLGVVPPSSAPRRVLGSLDRCSPDPRRPGWGPLWQAIPWLVEVSERPRDERMMWWKSGAAGAFPAASCALDIRLPVSELVFRFAIGDSEPEGDLWSWIHILDLAMLVKFTWCIDKRLLSLARLSREDVVFPGATSCIADPEFIGVNPLWHRAAAAHLPGTRTAMAASEPACVLPCVRELTTACKVLPAVLPCTPFVNKLKIWNEAAGRLLFTLQRIERYIPPTITNVALQSDNGNYSLWSGILAFFPNLRTLDFRVKESSGDSRPSEAPHFLASLSTILPPTLESLRVHIWSSRAVLPGGQTGRVGLSRLPSADELQAELLKGASRSRDGLRRSIWRGLSNPSLFAGESDTQGGGLYWAETSGVKSAADGPDGKQQGTTEGGDKVRVLFRPRNWVLIVATRVQVFHGLLPPPTALRLPQTPPARSPTLQSIPIPLLSTCPHVLSSPRLRRKSDALPPVGPQRSARAALLSRRLSVFAHSPLALAELSTGLTLGGSVVGESVKDIMQAAFENGINMFDTAEDYQKGAAEREMGHAIKELGWRRTDLVISTKIFWSHEPGTGPNDTGLSHKHVIEGTKACFATAPDGLCRRHLRASLRYHRLVPMEEIVRAFNYVIDQGWAFYWGTSQWRRTRSRSRIVSVYLSRDLPSLTRSTDVATRLNLIAPDRSSASTNDSMFHRERPEKEYAPLYAKYGLGTTAFSALQGGLLTGKTARAPPPCPCSGATEGPQGEELLWKVRLLSQIAAGASFLPDLLNSGRNPLALAWVAAHRHTSTVILGVSSVAQLEANLGALEVLPKLDAAVLARIEAVLGNHPQEPVRISLSNDEVDNALMMLV